MKCRGFKTIKYGVRRIHCNACGYTWRPIKKHHKKDFRRLRAYLLDGSTLRRLGERWSVSGSTAYRRIQRSLHQSIAVDAVVVLKPFKYANILLLDAKHFVIRKKVHTLYVSLDAHTGLPVAWVFKPGSESRDGYDELLGLMRQRKVNVLAVVSDNDQSIRCAVNDWYPDAVQQKCAFHVLKKAFLKLNGRRLIHTIYGKKIWHIVRHIALEYDEQRKARGYLLKIQKKYPLHEKVWDVLARNLHTIYQFESRRDLPIPRTSNQIENFMGVIEQRVKTFRSAKNPNSLIKILSAFIKIKYKSPTN